MRVAHFHERVSEILQASTDPLAHAVVQRILVDLHRTVLAAPGEAVAHRFYVEPGMFQLYVMLSCMLH